MVTNRPTGSISDLARFGIEAPLDLASLLDVVFRQGFGYALGGSPWRRQETHEAGVFRQGSSMTKRMGRTPADALARALADALEEEAAPSGGQAPPVQEPPVAPPPRPLGTLETDQSLHRRAIEKVAEHFHLQVVSSATDGYDAIASDGTRYLVKARTVGSARDYELGAIKDIDQRQFDYLVFVMHDRTSDEYHKWRMSFDFALHKAAFEPHKNGHVLYLPPSVRNNPPVERIR